MSFPKHITLYYIKPSRNDNQIRIEVLCNQHHNLLESEHIIYVRHAYGSLGNVNVLTQARPFTIVKMVALQSSRVEFAPLVDIKGDIQHVRVVIECLSYAVAIIYILVENKDFTTYISKLVLVGFNCDRYVVKQIEAYRFFMFGIVTGRSDYYNRVLNMSIKNTPTSLDRTSSRQPYAHQRILRQIDTIYLRTAVVKIFVLLQFQTNNELLVSL